MLVTLSPEGHLQMELPGVFPTRRVVALHADSIGSTLLRVLRAQLEEKAEIGEDGAPTRVQVKHWERHEVFKDSRCRFCLAEGQAKASTRKRHYREVSHGNQGEVRIRKLASKEKGSARQQVSNKSAGELDL